MASGQTAMLICGFDRMICFIVSTIDQYTGSHFQYGIVADQNRIFRRLGGLVTFDAENPITLLRIVSVAHRRYLRSTRKICGFESSTDEFGELLSFGRRQYRPRRRLARIECGTAAGGQAAEHNQYRRGRPHAPED